MRRNQNFARVIRIFALQFTDYISQGNRGAVVYDLPLINLAFPPGSFEFLIQPFGCKPILLSSAMAIDKARDEFFFDLISSFCRKNEAGLVRRLLVVMTWDGTL